MEHVGTSGQTTYLGRYLGSEFCPSFCGGYRRCIDQHGRSMAQLEELYQSNVQMCCIVGNPPVPMFAVGGLSVQPLNDS